MTRVERAEMRRLRAQVDDMDIEHRSEVKRLVEAMNIERAERSVARAQHENDISALTEAKNVAQKERSMLILALHRAMTTIAILEKVKS